METITCEQTTHETDSQLTIHDTEWTDTEREQMKILGYDDMDVLRAWFE